MLETPALRLLCQGYLTQDWPEDYDGDVWAAVSDFAAIEPDAAGLATEVNAVLATFSTEKDVREFVRNELDLGYLPEADGWGYRAWLAEVVRRVTAN